jgi:hypothetical protein
MSGLDSKAGEEATMNVIGDARPDSAEKVTGAPA